jgi:Asp-tRNA(Asn)/Glu-tRNA(Gln) amidotransferase B subunit
VARGARVEPALRDAPPGARYQFLRQGWFYADPVESRAGEPVWNRTITLKDTWAARAASEARPASAAPNAAPARGEGGGGDAASPRGGRAELRAEQRAATPEVAARYARYTAGPEALPPDDADLLASDAALSAFLDAALAAHPRPRSVARWLLNDLAGLARGADPASLPLGAAAFGRFVALVDAGRLTPAAGKVLLADLVASGAEPEPRMKALGLEKVEDRGAIDAAVAKVIAARRAEADRYRAGETKLLGVLLGAVMKETQGAADAAAVRQALQRALDAR